MSTTRIILFGMHGQVGARLMETLSTAGYEVTGIDRARCNFMTTSAKEIGIIIRAVEPQLIINAAAYTAVDAAEKDADAARRINAGVPEMIAAAAQEVAIPFLHCSTDYVFDGLRGTPYDTEDATNPLSVYGLSKRAGEVAALAHGAHVFRLQWVFDTRGKNFFETMVKLLRERESLGVVADQLGAPSHALHIAQAVTAAVPLLVKRTLPPAIYHLTAAGHTSWHGFACGIAHGIGSTAHVRPIVTAEYSLPATRPKDARLDTQGLAAHGIAMPHWRDGLALAMKETHADS